MTIVSRITCANLGTPKGLNAASGCGSYRHVIAPSSLYISGPYLCTLSIEELLTKTDPLAVWPLYRSFKQPFLFIQEFIVPVADVGFWKGGCISAKLRSNPLRPLQNPTPATVNAVLPGFILSLLLRPQNVVWVNCHHPVIHPLQVSTNHEP